MKSVIISGSVARWQDQMEAFGRKLQTLGVSVVWPTDYPADWNNLSVQIQKKLLKEMLLEYLDNIKRSDVLFAFNPNGYVGNGVSFEIGYAVALGKSIYTMESDTDLSRQLFYAGIAPTPEELAKAIV